MISNLVEVYCLASDLARKIDEKVLKSRVGRKGKLTRADYITLSIIKQEVGIRTNKKLYELTKYCMRKEFPIVPSYQQFCVGLESNFIYLAIIGQLLAQMNKSPKEGEYIVDSTPLPICKIIYSNAATSYGIADYGKNLEGWYFGFKLHIIININMEIVSFKFTQASTSDLKGLDDNLVKNLFGYLIGDKGYISSKKTKTLLNNGLQLVTRRRKNMKKLPISSHLLSLLKKRTRVETVFGQLKDNFLLICRKARSIQSFFSNACAAITTYIIKSKPKLLSLDYSNCELPLIS